MNPFEEGVTIRFGRRPTRKAGQRPPRPSARARVTSRDEASENPKGPRAQREGMDQQSGGDVRPHVRWGAEGLQSRGVKSFCCASHGLSCANTPTGRKCGSTRCAGHQGRPCPRPSRRHPRRLPRRGWSARVRCRPACAAAPPQDSRCDLAGPRIMPRKNPAGSAGARADAVAHFSDPADLFPAPPPASRALRARRPLAEPSSPPPGYEPHGPPAPRRAAPHRRAAGVRP
jgi:hypothetical protein